MKKQIGLLSLVLLFFIPFMNCSQKITPLPPQEKIDLDSEFSSTASDFSIEDLANLYYIHPLRKMQSRTQYVGDSVQLSSEIETAGLTNLSYRWYKDGVEVPKDFIQENTKLVLGSVDLESSGQYQMDIFLVKSGEKPVRLYSDIAVLRVRPDSERPTFPELKELSPVTQTISQGGDLTLEVEVAGTPQPKIVWLKNNVILQGEDETTLEIQGLLPSDQGSYQAIAKNIEGEVSSYLFSVNISNATCSFRVGDEVTRIEPGSPPIEISMCHRPLGQENDICITNNLAAGVVDLFICREDSSADQTQTASCQYEVANCSTPPSTE